MLASLTLRERLMVGGLALLCTAAGIAMLVEVPGHAGILFLTEAVDLLRL